SVPPELLEDQALVRLQVSPQLSRRVEVVILPRRNLLTGRLVLGILGLPGELFGERAPTRRNGGSLLGHGRGWLLLGLRNLSGPRLLRQVVDVPTRPDRTR